MKKQNGITLIALVITIIIMLILVAVTITYSLKSGLLTKTTEAKFKSELSRYKEELALYINDRIAEDENYDYTKLYANKTTGIDGDKKIDGGIKDVIPSITTDHMNLLEIQEGKLILIKNDISKNSEYEQWTKKIGIDIAEGYSDSDIEIANLSKDIYVWYKDNTLYFANDNKYMPEGSLSYGNIKGKTYEVITKSSCETDLPWENVKKNITTVTFLTEIIPTETAYWFNCTALNTINNMENLKTNFVTNMEGMFEMCAVLETLNASSWDTSNVINMGGMFEGCYKLKLLDVSNWDTSKVTNMSYLFNFCKELTDLDVSKWNTSAVTDMRCMFAYCYKLASLDLNSFDTSNVTNMASMFSSCFALQTLDISNFDTSNVTNMGSMFCNCRELQSLDITNFDTSYVVNMALMFNNCYVLQTLDVSNFDTSRVTNMTGMFCNSNELKNIYVGNGWNTNLVIKSRRMFDEDTLLPNFDSNATDKAKAFVGEGGYLSSKSLGDVS